MKYLSKFKKFESGVSEKNFLEIKEIQDVLVEIFKDTYPIVSVNESKYGRIIEINFYLRGNVINYENLDDIYKTMDFVYETISVLEQYILHNFEYNSLYLSSFFYLGKIVKGEKDGRNLTIENVLPKLEETINMFARNEISQKFGGSISRLSFLIN